MMRLPQLWLFPVLCSVSLVACGSGTTGSGDALDTSVPYETISPGAITTTTIPLTATTLVPATPPSTDPSGTSSLLTETASTGPDLASNTLFINVSEPIDVDKVIPTVDIRHALVRDRSQLSSGSTGSPFPELFLDGIVGKPEGESSASDDLALGWETVFGYKLPRRPVDRMTYSWPRIPNAWIEFQQLDDETAAAAEIERWRHHVVPAWRNAFAGNEPGAATASGAWHIIASDRVTIDDGVETNRTRWRYARIGRLRRPQQRRPSRHAVAHRHRTRRSSTF
jgi:hypothetical protein